MGAVGIAAEVDVGAQIAVVAGDLLGNHVPQLKLADAGRIHHVPTRGQRNQPGGSGGVLSLLILFANFPHLQPQAELDRVEKR